MKNKELYKQEVDDGSQIRYDINENYYSKLNKLAKLYRLIFKRRSKEFKQAHDINYYKGGWPKPNTPSKAYMLAEMVANVFTLIEFANLENDFKAHLQNKGINVDFQSSKGSWFNEIDLNLETKKGRKIKELWIDVFNSTDDMSDSGKDILQLLLNKASLIQKDICTLADVIRIEKAPMVEVECEIKAFNYTKAVNLKYKSLKDKDISQDLDKVKCDAENTSDALSIFEEDSYLDKEK